MIQSARLQAVQSPIIPIVGELIRSSPGTISLGQGIVSYPPPPEAIAQISEFLSHNHQYHPVQGIPQLREAIAHKLQTENQINMGEHNDVVVTAGSNMGFLNALLAIADPGDEIILPTPYYFNHEMAIAIANGRAVLVNTDENYQLRIDAIAQAITPKTKAIVTVSPNNPTGVVYPKETLKAVNALCKERGIYHITDETYEYFVYDDCQHFSPASLPDSHAHTISLFSLSKAYGFASWRIGYMVIPAHLMSAVTKIQDTNLICAAGISQYGALGALQAGIGFCKDKIEAIAQVRHLALKELDALSDICTIPAAKGAFYFLIKVHSDRDAFEITKQLIEQHKVAVIPGDTFGMTGCYLRVAYGALDFDTVAEGMGRLVTGLRAIV